MTQDNIDVTVFGGCTSELQLTTEDGEAADGFDRHVTYTRRDVAASTDG